MKRNGIFVLNLRFLIFCHFHFCHFHEMTNPKNALIWAIFGAIYISFYLCLFQTIALCGTAAALVCLSYTSTYGSALVLMAIAMACCGFHNSGILVNPQDIAPNHAGSVFGKEC